MTRIYPDIPYLLFWGLGRFLALVSQALGLLSQALVVELLV